MKSTKETVFDYIQRTIATNSNNKSGVTTSQISQDLNMQRSNVSSLLNELVKEERLLKTKSRPVLYQIKNSQVIEFKHNFTLIGENGSLKNAVQLAKAAMLYPQKSLNVLIASKSGCGSSHFASMMYLYAKENNIILQSAPLIKVNCKHYENNIAELYDELFGVNDYEKSAFNKAEGGILFVDNFDLLEGKQQSLVFDFMETGKLFINTDQETKRIDNVILILSCSPQSAIRISRRIAVTIELPELDDRPSVEKFDLINHFFSIEAINSKRGIETSSEVIEALLLSCFSFNIKELQIEIRSACANAYVRVINENNKRLEVVLDDFKQTIQRSLLRQKNSREDIYDLLGTQRRFVYDSLEGYLGSTPRKVEMYEAIDQQYKELIERGITDSSIEDIINTRIQSLFAQYRYKYQKGDANGLDQLSKIVDSNVISLVQKFLAHSEKVLDRKLKSNVIYGLSLHINSLLNLHRSTKRLDNDQIVKFIQEYPKEYALSVQFCDDLYDQFDLSLKIDEIVLITMFLVETDNIEEVEHPVLLYILHGSSTASSLSEVTNKLTHCNNSYAYDLNLESDIEEAIDEIRKLILDIDAGGGVIVIYDMGSIKTMLETLNEELNVKIRYMNIPITLLGIDIARKCSMDSDIDSVFHQTSLDYRRYSDREQKELKAIITLCHTGEGGAIQLKNFIDQHSKLGFQTIPLAISDRAELYQSVTEIRRAYSIHAFVGTYDPKLLGIPYIPISKIFENDGKVLDSILSFQPVNGTPKDYESVYQYFEDNFVYANIAKLKTSLPLVMDELSIFYELDEDQYMGLFVHIACMVERILDGKSSPLLKNKNELINKLNDDYEVISKIMKQLEKRFKIIIDDNEVATIIMIIKKL